MEHNSAWNSTLVLDPATFYLYMTGFHGSLKQVCSGLEGYCLVLLFP